MLTHIRTSNIVQRHYEQIIGDRHHPQPESLKKRFDRSQEGPK